MVQPSLKYWIKRMDKGCKTFDNTILTHIDCTELAILLEELQKLKDEKNS